MKEHQNTQNLESRNSAALLSQAELDEFRKLPKEEQKKQQEARLKKLEELQNEFRKAVEEATKTGNVEQAKKLKLAFDKDAKELKQLVETPVISAEYKYKDEKGKEKKETITLDIEKELEDFSSFYKDHDIELPDGFNEKIKDIWEKNVDAITAEIEKKGFDMVLLVPKDLPKLKELEEKMTAGYEKEKGNKTYWGEEADSIKSAENGLEIVLLHSTPELNDHPELNKTLNKKIQSYIDSGENLTLQKYLLLQAKLFKDKGIHIDVKNYVSCPGSTIKTDGGGVRVIDATWYPDHARLYVRADDAGGSGSSGGCRLSRSFS